MFSSELVMSKLERKKILKRFLQELQSIYEDTNGKSKKQKTITVMKSPVITIKTELVDERFCLSPIYTTQVGWNKMMKQNTSKYKARVPRDIV